VAINPSLPIRTLPELIAYARQSRQAHVCQFRQRHAGAWPANCSSVRPASTSATCPTRAAHPPWPTWWRPRRLVFDPLSTQFIKQGKLRALAYFGGARSPDLPNVPSIRDAGVKGWEDSLAGAFFITAPRNVPPDVLAKLRQWIGEILAEPTPSPR
jgi:hypothetical protein